MGLEEEWGWKGGVGKVGLEKVGLERRDAPEMIGQVMCGAKRMVERLELRATTAGASSCPMLLELMTRCFHYKCILERCVRKSEREREREKRG